MSINKSIFEHTWKASRFHFWNLTFLYPRKKHLIWQFHGYETQIRNTQGGDTNAKSIQNQLAIFSKQIAFCMNWYQIESLELSHFFILERIIFPIEKRRNENDRTKTREIESQNLSVIRQKSASELMIFDQRNVTCGTVYLIFTWLVLNS